jgi:hypothetical protein
MMWYEDFETTDAASACICRERTSLSAETGRFLPMADVREVPDLPQNTVLVDRGKGKFRVHKF